MEKDQLSSLQAEVFVLRAQMKELLEVIGERLHDLRLEQLVDIWPTGQRGRIVGFLPKHVWIVLEGEVLATKFMLGQVRIVGQVSLS